MASFTVFKDGRTLSAQTVEACWNSLAHADLLSIQADIFDHLYAILPEFGLRVFQQPSGADVQRAVATARERADAEEDAIA